jgi:hypothetical protein
MIRTRSATARVAIALVALACAWSPAAQAELPNPLADGLRHCAAESDQAKRLACFDRLAATVPKVEADQFGLTADIAHKRAPVAAQKPTEAVLPGKIIALRQGPRGELIFTLDNQQVWDQSEPEPSKTFKVGEDVHIEHGAMGSLWLSADKGRKTRVKRVS